MGWSKNIIDTVRHRHWAIMAHSEKLSDKIASSLHKKPRCISTEIWLQTDGRVTPKLYPSCPKDKCFTNFLTWPHFVLLFRSEIARLMLQAKESGSSFKLC